MQKVSYEFHLETLCYSCVSKNEISNEFHQTKSYGLVWKFYLIFVRYSLVVLPYSSTNTAVRGDDGSQLLRGLLMVYCIEKHRNRLVQWSYWLLMNNALESALNFHAAIIKEKLESI